MEKPTLGYGLNALPGMAFCFDVDVIARGLGAENCAYEHGG
ncbi:hypothetical protein [Chromobacterium piscinae]|nr:hypothetical protein [Chromobacterium piscinae]